MNTRTKLAAAALTMMVAVPAYAGKGGSAALINQAVASGSTDAIIAEVERTEALMCSECVQTLTALTEDSRYKVREVAGWWFARRPQLKDALVVGFVQDLQSGDSLHVRNAADFIGSVVELKALPALRAAITRGGLNSEAKLALVNAARRLAHVNGNPVLTTAMSDADPVVRAAAVVAWRDVLGQPNAIAVEPLLADADARVRAEAAAVMGAFADANAVGTLIQLVTVDTNAQVRRNAAWALGKIGSQAAAPALTAASADPSGLVRLVAKAALAQLH